MKCIQNNAISRSINSHIHTEKNNACENIIECLSILFYFLCMNKNLKLNLILSQFNQPDTICLKFLRPFFIQSMQIRLKLCSLQ